jgi:anti-sigma B factor antagonist
MDIEELAEGEFTILQLEGQMVGEENAELLRDKIESLVEAGKVTIIIDLADVTYVDSVGLGEFVLCYKTVSAKKGKLILRNLNEQIRVLLSRTKLSYLFDVGGD